MLSHEMLSLGKKNKKVYYREVNGNTVSYEEGIVSSINDRFIFVKFSYSTAGYGTACRPEDLVSKELYDLFDCFGGTYIGENNRGAKMYELN